MINLSPVKTLLLFLVIASFVACGGGESDDDGSEIQIETNDQEFLDDEEPTDEEVISPEPQVKKTPEKEKDPSKIDALGGMRMMQYSRPAIKKLIAALDNSDKNANQMALYSLPSVPGHFKDDPGQVKELIIPALLKIMNDKSRPVMRPFAVTKLLSLKEMGKPAVPDLIAGLDDKELRQHIAMGFGKMGPVADKALPKFKKLLTDSDAGARADAGRGLAQYGPRAASAVPDLVEVLEDKNNMVQSCAAKALGAIGPAAKSALSQLKNMATTGKGAARYAAAVKNNFPFSHPIFTTS